MSELSFSKAKFDYAQLGMHANAVRSAAFDLRAKAQMSVKMIIEVGVELERIKRLIGHGLFYEWIMAEFPWTPRTAERWIQLSCLRSKSDIVSDLTYTTLYKLTAKSVDSEAREDIIRRVAEGEIEGDEQVMIEIGRLTKPGADLAQMDAGTPDQISADRATPDAVAPPDGEKREESDAQDGEDDEDDEDDEDERWKMQMTEIAAALATGLGKRADEFFNIIWRIDGPELQYYYDRHLRELRRARKGRTAKA